MNVVFSLGMEGERPARLARGGEADRDSYRRSAAPRKCLLYTTGKCDSLQLFNQIGHLSRTH